MLSHCTCWVWTKGKQVLGVHKPDACTPQVFLPQNQGQLGLEGFIMGLLYLLFGLSVAFLTRYVPRLASASHRRVLSYTCVAFAAVVSIRSCPSTHGRLGIAGGHTSEEFSSVFPFDRKSWWQLINAL